MTRNPASRARAAGDNAEAAIERACASYARSGLALVQKRQTPYRIIGPVRAGKFTGVLSGKAPVDFDGILRGGRAVAFELKRAASTTSLPLGAAGEDRMRPEQVDALAARHALGALVGVVVALGPRWFWLPWPMWLRCVEDAADVGRVSLPLAAMVAHGVEMERAGRWLPAALDSEVGMFDIAAFEAAFAAWDANSGQCGCMGARREIIEASGLIEDALAEVKRLRAEVASLRATAAERAVFGIYDTTREPPEAP